MLLSGVLVHTDCPEGKEAYAYVDLTEYPHDANLTMNIILDIMKRYQHKPARKLHIQLDNCFRENKNKFVLSLGWVIVELGIFDEVRNHQTERYCRPTEMDKKVLLIVDYCCQLLTNFLITKK
jgi:hypothetical protein